VRDIVQVWIGQLSQKFIDAEIRFRACAPKAFWRLAELLKHAQRVQLTITFVHENEKRTRARKVKPLHLGDHVALTQLRNAA
jgi:hypothetical protein